MNTPRLSLARETVRALHVKAQLRAGVPASLHPNPNKWAGHSVVDYCPATTAVTTK